VLDEIDVAALAFPRATVLEQVKVAAVGGQV